MARKKRGAGGKLNRSEIVQTRLNPKMRFAAEIMARYERRTVSSLLEGLIEQTIKDYRIPAMIGEKAQANLLFYGGEAEPQKTSLKFLLDDIWTIEEADRFASFAMCFPDLLTEEEERLWNLIVQTPYFWAHFEINIESKGGKVVGKDVWPVKTYRGLIRENIREHWDLLNAIARGEEPRSKLAELKSPGRIVPKPKHIPTVTKVNPAYDD
jgi:hypothetical protein